jgi:hypothetical protein
MDQLIPTLQPYFTAKAPFQLPETWRQNIVRFAPWLVLIAVIFSALAVLSLLLLLIGVSAFTAFAPVSTLLAWVSLGMLAAQTVLLAKAFPGLKAYTENGWKYAFYASVLSVAWGAVEWIQAPFDISGLIGTLLGAYISFFILFQIRDYYTGAKKVADPVQISADAVK